MLFVGLLLLSLAACGGSPAERIPTEPMKTLQQDDGREPETGYEYQCAEGGMING